jgi:tricarballylate dehydrogenase
VTPGADVVVVGAGNAALCAALAARESGATVLVLEKAPEHLRGGNTYFTGGGFRFPYDGLEDIRRLIPDISDSEAEQVDVGAYPQADFYADLMRVSESLADEDLVDTLVKQAFPTMLWLGERGIRWALMYGRQAFKQDGKFRFWGGLIVESIGAGKGLIDGLIPIAERAGIEVRYRTAARELLLDGKGSIRGVLVQDDEGLREVGARAVVLACGGFEANSEMRTRYLGQGWELAKVRGTQFNTGDGIQMALRAGAMPYGHWSGCHAVAWDLNAPPFGDRKIADLFQKHSYPFGLIVNVRGERFVDEGADFRNYTYARYGKEVLVQPQRVAFQLFDAKVTHLLRDEYKISQVTKATTGTIGELADALGIDRTGLERTVADFNAAVLEGNFDPTVKDGKSTGGIAPPKSNWALPLDSPPYEGYAVTCGITFTFGGLRINPACEVMDTRGEVMRGLYAAGELVGGLFYFNYAGGSGLMAGATFGRLAGTSAGRFAAGKATESNLTPPPH